MVWCVQLVFIFFFNLVLYERGFPGGSSGKEPPANAGDRRDMGLIPGSGRSSGGGHGHPLQYSCLENSMERVALQAKSMQLQRIGHDGALGGSVISLH